MNDTPRQAVPLPDEARILAEEAFAKVYNDPVTLAACLRAALEAAAPALRAQGAAAEREREPDWEWANPIADRYTIRSPRDSGGCFLHCTACDQDLLSVGEMDLWEFALDAKRHDLEKHADLLEGTATDG